MEYYTAVKMNMTKKNQPGSLDNFMLSEKKIVEYCVYSIKQCMLMCNNQDRVNHSWAPAMFQVPTWTPTATL